MYPYITLTDFEMNTIKCGHCGLEEKKSRRKATKGPAPDTAEFVAEKILEVVKTGKAEQFTHDWMNPAKRK